MIEKITYSRLLTLVGCKGQPKRVLFDGVEYTWRNDSDAYRDKKGFYLNTTIANKFDDRGLASMHLIEVLE